MQVDLKDVHFTYPGEVCALSGINFSVSSGERVAIVGQNGAGKTTLVKHINGLLRPTAGQVLLDGKDTADLSIAKLSRYVGYVFQNPDIQLFSTSVEEEVAFGPTNLGFTGDDLERMISFALKITGLEDSRKTNPYDLSPSWRKMVAFASVLAMDSQIVILDEPTTGQDAVMIESMRNIISQLSAQGKTVIAITHDIDFGVEIFPRLIAMSQGRIILDGPTIDVIAQERKLEETYVNPPQLTRLGNRLGFPVPVTTNQEFLSRLGKHQNVN